MDAEMFSTEPHTGGGFHLGKNTNITVDKITDNHVKYSKFRLYQVVKAVAYAIFVFLIIHIIVDFVDAIPICVSAYKQGFFTRAYYNKSSFSQKEGLQYLGGIADSVRDDYGSPQADSLAEQAQAAQDALSNPAVAAAVSTAQAAGLTVAAPVAKSGFYSRERMSHPPSAAKQDLRKIKLAQATSDSTGRAPHSSVHY